MPETDAAAKLLAEVYDLNEAAAYTHRHPQVLRHHRYKTGLLRGRLKGGSLIFTRAELDNFLATVGTGGRQPKNPVMPEYATNNYRERQALAVKLWGEAVEVDEIMRRLGYSSRRSVRRAIEAGMLAEANERKRQDRNARRRKVKA